MDTYHGLAELEAAVGQEIGPTAWFLIDQARVDGFADDTEDHQWIHVDPERAAAGRSVARWPTGSSRSRSSRT
jgi:acyl dehydratase